GTSDSELAGAVGSVARDFTPEKTAEAAACSITERTHLGGSTAAANAGVVRVTAHGDAKAPSATHSLDGPSMPDGIYKVTGTFMMVRVGAPANFYVREVFVVCTVVAGSASALSPSTNNADEGGTYPTPTLTWAGTSDKFRLNVQLGAGAGTWNLFVAWDCCRVTSD